MANPLLQSHRLPPFSSISAAQVVPAVEQLINEAETELSEQLANITSPSWDSLALPIEERQDRLSKAWGPVGHLNSVCNSDELRKAYEEGRQLFTAYYTGIGQNVALYQAYEAVKDRPDFTQLSQPQQQTINNAIRDFKLSGVALAAKDKQRYAEIQAKLSQLTSSFSNNVLDATHGWFLEVNNESELSGLPEFAVAAAKQAATDRELDGWVFTLDGPVYSTVITQADDASLREALYRGYNTRASEQGPTAGQWDNSDLIEEIMSLRQELAGLLGFNNYAELSIAPKMAESTDQVIDFLQDLAERCKPFATRELQELREFAAETFGVTELNAWDIPYYSEKLKQARYSISQEELRPYFPVDHVVTGLFRVAHSLFGLEFVDQTPSIETWHKDVKYFEIRRDGEAVAGFYFDLFARSGKRGGAWMDECRVRRKVGNEIQLPVAYLVCNFNPPLNDTPSLLTHNDVTTLFHEFGHGIHHMLTKIDVAAVSGINGVAWDAVELPSQFMENFCWEREVLEFLSSHYKTGEPLPVDKLDNMLAAKNFQSALFMIRQLEFSLFDFKLHMLYGTDAFVGTQALLDEIRQQVAVFSPPSFNRFQNSFSHIFAGGYAAGYYSYKWAEVLSADAYSAFEEAGIFDSATGQRYLSEILEKGGSDEAMNLFKNFRGREPKVDALLRHSGLSA
ncbi:oligopeptidase A [Teredinibacter waterburyi]|uniref:oligopeptidase A n=1 Tax=Teredinibacter waterburyi TaxID=1500538 RepID=UPI00165FCE60|nr:oligopeptidase A [Teredinibacter waterburyi]